MPSPGTKGVFAVPLGVDFSTALIDGLGQWLTDAPPETVARTEIFVNTDRLRRRLLTLYAERGAGFVPRITPIAEIAVRPELIGVPAAISPLRLRLELVRLIRALVAKEPDLAPSTALYDLADSLAELLGEMQEEGVRPARLAEVDAGQHAAHWKRSKAFLSIVAQYVDAQAAMTPAARQAAAIERLAHMWAQTPPQHPLIVAGSTGSRGITLRLMEVVAAQAAGAVVLPGLDPDMPADIWRGLLEGRRAGLAGEDHPQFRLARVCEQLALDPHRIPFWNDAVPANPARNAWFSLALRPAPVTDQWRAARPELLKTAPPDAAFAAVSLIEAPSPRAEAAAIALRLRQAAETGQIAALVTPDRVLARRVTVALDRWRIRPDDSAGAALDQTSPGRLLAMAADLMANRRDGARLLAVLKHPLTHSGRDDRGAHLLRSRDLELQVLRGTMPEPTLAAIQDWAKARVQDTDAAAWAAWLTNDILSQAGSGPRPLAEHVATHIALAEHLGAGPDADGAGALWEEEAGAASLAAMRALAADAEAGGALEAAEYRALVLDYLRDTQMRSPVRTRSGVMIWGALEARVMGADLMILAGLNDGVWPAPDQADPWLNRAMRAEAGLRLPERRTGLSAHDFQQAAAAAEIWLSRAIRDGDSETVPSRWLNRLTTLLDGSEDGPGAVRRAMKRRGDLWLERAARLDRPAQAVDPAPRPAPAPPLAVRPDRLSVTAIERLIRDPYAIYAERVLRLRPLDPLRPVPDMRRRGTVLHAALERFIAETRDGLPADAEARLIALTEAELANQVAWPVARALWHAALMRAVPMFLAGEAERRRIGSPWQIETPGETRFDAAGITLTAKPDRIDLCVDGSLAIYDYKSGRAPTAQQQKSFQQQLRLEAMMAARGAFGDGQARQVSRIGYIGLSDTNPPVIAGVSDADCAETERDFLRLMARFADESHGYVARRAMERLSYSGNYDHLARYGEWQDDALPAHQRVGA